MKNQSNTNYDEIFYFVKKISNCDVYSTRVCYLLVQEAKEIMEKIMRCYKHTTFCASRGCLNKCGRLQTKEQIEEAKNLNLDMMWADFCDEFGEPVYLSE